MSNSPIFVTTRWTLVRQAGGAASGDAGAALASLCQDYWRPLYHYARRQGHTPEEAQDLTQGFLCALLERQAVAQADPERGRFRTFLLKSFQNYIGNERRRALAQKRGAGLIVSLEAEAEAGFAPGASESRTPAEEYERTWGLALLDRVMGRLRDECERVGRGALFAALYPRLSGASDDPQSHAELGVALGLSEKGVSSALHRLRRRYGELLREEIADTVGSAEEVEDELRHLLRVLATR
ncbi:MAG: sigma-70 family RNA polymerase sigma factor [Verrucomicrobia bacterium]|nr:sigma-70 family RNA polymerase sigma factor [Verrucomicrobiota bacterium]